MAPRIKIPLPQGSLRVAFAGEKYPIVSGIAPDSPISEHMKVGYKFVELMFGDGAIVEGLGTYQLVEALNDSVDDPERFLKMEMCFPESSKVVLGPGSGGLIIEDRGGKAVVTRCTADSPVKKELRVGMVLDSLQLADGFTAIGHSAEEYTALLNSSDEDAKRILTMISPDSTPSPKSTVLPKFSSVDLPLGTAEELGLMFTGEIATIGAISTDAVTPCRPGMMVSVLTLPDGNQLFQLSGDDLSDALDKTCEVEGRILVCKNPALVKLPAEARTKIMFPTEGSLADFGFEVAGAPAVISNVDEASPFAGLVVKGFVVKQIGWTRGTEFDDIDSNDVEDILQESSGIEGRYMVCLNTVSVKASPSKSEGNSPYNILSLPAGKLGLSFQGKPPTCKRISDTSIMKGQVQVGDVAHSLVLPDGTIYENMDTLQLTDALKSSSTETGRQLRMLNSAVSPGSAPATTGDSGADYKVLQLPMGRLGMTFRGTDTRATISKVKADSPFIEEDVEGMGVDTITVKNREHMEMNAIEVATLIKSTSDVPGRVLTVRENDSDQFQKLPETTEVVLPTGTIGVTFASTPPTAKAFKDDSPVGHLILPGMYVDELRMPDGYSHTGLSAKELVTLLGSLSKEEGRTLILKNSKTTKPTPKRETFPDEKLIDLPAGKLGISFKGKRKARISRIHQESVLLGVVYVGMQVESIEIPGGSKFQGMTAKEVANTLVDTKNVSGRKLKVIAPSASDGADTTADSTNYSVSARG